MRLLYQCPSKKCRWPWDKISSKVENDTCPRCGIKDLAPLDIQETDNVQ